MTGAQTDTVTVGMFDRVASALVRIASKLFTEFKALPEDTPAADRDRIFAAWQMVRETAMKLTTRREIRLSKWELEELHDALKECQLSPDLEFVFEQCYPQNMEASYYAA